MMTWFRRDKEKEKGFTLVELIVVMAILAVLAALAVPRFGGVLSGAKTDANKANEATIERAAEMYIAKENFTLPASGSSSIAITDLISKDYLKSNAEVSGAPTFLGPNKETYTVSVDSKGNVTVTSTPSASGGGEGGGS